MISSIIRRRLLQVIPVVIGSSFLTFFLVNLLPGSVVLTILGPDATQSAIRSFDRQLGLNEPLLVRYGKWLYHAVQGQLGTSLLTAHQPVAHMVFQRLPVSVELVIAAIIIALVPAVLLSCFAARRPGGILDRGLSVLSILGVSTPNFVVALGAIYLLADYRHLLPAIGFVPLATSVTGNLKSMVLPAGTLAVGLFSIYTRVLKADMTNQMLNEEYVNTARTKGTRDWLIIYRHVLRNSSFTLVTIVALNLGVLLGATVILEQVFALPGVGSLLLEAINQRDEPVVEGVVLCLSTAVIFMSLLADVVYMLLDPRIRHGAS